MKKLLRDTAVTLIGVILCSNMAVSDVVKGQKIYLKKMKSKCAISGSEFAGKYSPDQWEEIYDAGKLKDEVKRYVMDTPLVMRIQLIYMTSYMSMQMTLERYQTSKIYGYSNL